MNTFLIQIYNGIYPCFGIEQKGNELVAITKNFEHNLNDKFPDLVYEKDFIDIAFANESDLENSLHEVEKYFDKIEQGMYCYKYPSKDEFISLLDKGLYFQMIIKKIVNSINEKVIVDLDTITWDCLKYQYNRILTDYKVKL